MHDTEPTLIPAAPPQGLAALEARVHQDLQWLALPGKSWTPATVRDGVPVIDVAIIGGGQAGMAASVALSHLGIPNVIYDQSPKDFEGPWATTARMETLRSPKTLTGPALGFPALTFRAWFEAQFGLDAWEALDKIPRLQWMEYLRWFRRVMQLDIRNEHRVLAVQPRADGIVALQLQSPAGTSTVLARRVVVATGRDGLGGASVPPLAAQLPRERWAHSSDVFDYASLKGKRVGVVGGGSSAMDSAATALEEGAARVDLLIRRKELPRINKGKGAGNPGLVNGHLHLPDEWKWRIRHYVNVQQVPPPSGSTRRVSRFANARFLLGTASCCRPTVVRWNWISCSSPPVSRSTGACAASSRTSHRTSSTGATATPRRPVKKTRNWPTRPTWARCSSSSRRRRAACRDWSVCTASAIRPPPAMARCPATSRPSAMAPTAWRRASPR
jgi:thioredoxin reductase